MKKKTYLTKAMLIFNLLILILTLGDFLALHDIQNDYVSTKMLDLHQITTSTPLPAWTATQGEWQVVSISFWLRVLFLLANLALLWYLSQKTVKALSSD